MSDGERLPAEGEKIAPWYTPRRLWYLLIFILGMLAYACRTPGGGWNFPLPFPTGQWHDWMRTLWQFFGH